MERWRPSVELTKQEQRMMKRLTRVRALFGYLRLHRHELFDSAFKDELTEMYRDNGAGDEPHAPAMLCMVLLLQGYVGASDAEAVELAVMDLRWQMVLGCLGADRPLRGGAAPRAAAPREVLAHRAWSRQGCHARAAPQAGRGRADRLHVDGRARDHDRR